MPAGLLYQREFITPSEEEALLDGIRELPLSEARYKAYTAKRHIAVFGAGYDSADAFPHALVTEYRPGTQLGWRDEIRCRWQHSVSPTRELRYSLTFRTRRAARG